MLFTTILATLAAVPAIALPTIEAKGSKFFTSDGDQWYIKGIAYQLTPDDPLAQGDQCQLDASLMKTLGANAIRVYHVDPEADHDACMSAFSDAGIYVFLDLDTFSTYILPDNPSWNSSQLQAYGKVMDVFQGYDNVAGFFVGNEVLTTGANSIAAPYVKAAARDMKAYRDSKGYRNIPIGYSAADIASLRPNLQNYLACGTNKSESLDFFSLNAYEWCGDSTFQESGYAALQANATDYDIPIFFSETGCIVPSPRSFGDQSAILGPDMADTWSGAIIYEWIQENNMYGLISYNPSFDTDPGNYAVSGTPTPRSPDFDNLKSQWATLSPTGVKAADYKPSLTPPPCPAFTSAMWEVNQDVALPTLNQKFNADVSSSIQGGHASGSAHATGTAHAATGTGVSAAAEHTGDSPSSTSPAESSTSSGSASSSKTAVGVDSFWYTILSLIFLF